jgi:hypothetical protein
MIAKRHLKPSTATSSTSTSASASAIPAATTVTTSTSLQDNTMIMTKIENATEGLPYHCFNYISNRVLPVSRENALTPSTFIPHLSAGI